MRPLRILIVDDSEPNRRLFERMLKLLGHSSDVARSGLDALDAVGRGRYDLLFMDVEMPGLDGRAATRIIRERQVGTSGPRIVGITGWGSDADRDRCLAAGMDACLVKPVAFEDLRAEVARTESAIGDRDAPG